VQGPADWARTEGVTVVVDATHPFAETISGHAAEACARTGLPLLRLVRPQWQARDGDDWRHAALADAAAILPSVGTRVLLTSGRPGPAAFAALDQRQPQPPGRSWLATQMAGQARRAAASSAATLSQPSCVQTILPEAEVSTNQG
jgi:precorrin-6x reductase